MKAKKMIVPVLMGVLMAFAILPMTAGKAYATDYFELIVGGAHVDSYNAPDILGDGTVSYNATSNTLTLNGATITMTGASVPIRSDIPDLKIEVKGENKLSGRDNGIYTSESVTITGGGSLEAEGSHYGISAFGELKIEGSCKVQAKGANAIYSANKITLGYGLAVTEPEGGHVGESVIIDQNGYPATSVTIEPAVKMSGDGTEDSPYQIKTYEDLKEFASIVNGKHQAPQNTAACAELENTIIAKNDPSDAEYASDWTPIGTSSNPYIGHFDGDNHIIKGLSNEEQTNVSNADYQGLFGCIGKQDDTVKGEVKNVGLEGGKIIGKSYVGGVVGYNIGGEITNCYNTGAVSGIGIDVGGVTGYSDSSGTITNCYNTGAVSGNGYVGGVTGYSDSSGTITNCYNTGAVSGIGYVGGVAGDNSGTITNCYNTGAVRGAGGIVGGVAGYNSSDITNCYNTGAVSGTGSYVGGVAGRNSGETITNCYNTGAVSGTGSDVGGVAGDNSGTITNCYNTGAVSGNGYVGGVAGFNNSRGTITNCYYDRAFNMFTKAVGDTGDTGNVKNVKGLTTSQMTGTEAIGKDNMAFEDTGSSPWLVKGDGPGQNGVYYWYYPHLEGFNFDSDGKQMTSEIIAAANWPAKLIAATEWSSEAASYPYTASPQGPAVTKVTASQKPVIVPGDKTGLYSRKTDSGWDALTAAPTGKGTYKLTIKDGDDVIDEIVFVILQNTDYTVAYHKQTGENPAVWSTDNVEPIAAGTYKAVVTDTDGTVLGEKVFHIKQAPLTITAKDQTLTYNGQTQGEGDTAYEDAAQIAEKVTVKGLQGSDELTKIEVDGQGKEVGEYDLVPNDAAVGTVTGNYDITYVNGTLTITKMSITPSVSIEGWVYGSAENKPVVTGNSGGGKETFLYKKTDEPDSAYTETVPTDAGEYTVKAKIAETANYKAGEATVDFTISPADMEVTAGDYQGTYDGAGHGITVNAPEGATVEYSGDGGETWTGEKPVFTEAGTHNTDFRVSLANYKEYTGSRQVIILQAAITIKADDKSSKYGETLKKLTYKVSGAYVKGDDLGVKLSTAAKKTAPGTTAIKVSWNRDPNYEAKLVNGKYTVKKENTKPSGPTKAEKKAARIALDAGVVARSSGKKVTASWGKVKGASSYVIYANYCDQKKCKKLKTVSGKTTSFNITKVNGKKFDPKKNLKFYVVAYKTVKGKKVKLATSITAHAPGSKNSKRTNVTGVKVKKASFTLKKGKTAKIKAKLVLQKKSRKPLKHEAKFRYATSNTKVAKVNKKGKITAVGKGKCTVYVYAVSGVSKKIKVTVK